MVSDRLFGRAHALRHILGAVSVLALAAPVYAQDSQPPATGAE